MPVVVIEHDLDVVKTADRIVGLGPEGGPGGGTIVAEGTPEEVAAQQASHTGQFLRKRLPRAVRVAGRAPVQPRGPRKSRRGTASASVR